MAIKRGIDKAVEVAVKELHKMSKPTKDQREIAQVGTISANNDETIGNIIAEAMNKVGKEGVITVEEAKGMETTLDVVEGMQFDRGYLSPYFVTDPDRMEVAMDDPYLRERASDVRDLGRRILMHLQNLEVRSVTYGPETILVGEEIKMGLMICTIQGWSTRNWGITRLLPGRTAPPRAGRRRVPGSSGGSGPRTGRGVPICRICRWLSGSCCPGPG